MSTNVRWVLIGVAVVVVLAVAGVWYWRAQQGVTPATEIVALQSAQGSEGFARVTEAKEMSFPLDHGPHPDYQTEWWYYTGNLMAEDGRRFGYQLTFFRRGITPGTLEGRTSDWATNQIYFAHFAITDAQGNTHNEKEIFSRGAAGLAGASGEPFRVWIEDWSSTALNADGSKVELKAESEKIDGGTLVPQGRLRTADGGGEGAANSSGAMALDLTLTAAKAPVVHGENGVSQKTETSGNASYYVSFTRMPTQGTVTVGGQTFQVTGTSWFDHEWGTTSLGADAAGWDWFSIQLDDNREVMDYQIRNKDGSIEPLSSGTLVEADGTTRYLKRDEVKITPQEFWTSSYSQGKYPNKWKVEIPSAGIDITLTPLIPDQEMRVSFTYWEGAVNIEGISGGKNVRGQGYVEMTGYGVQARGDVGY